MKATMKMPKVADSTDSVTVIEWCAAPGDRIAEGEMILIVETDKATVEIPAPLSGTVLEILAAVDEDITTGTPIAVFETE
jgi:pyruvate dehydrogenase E2 component (dihydrolipoamide acetyltransferase)